ncbi:hypothetical protein B0G77_8168 [Paraburkholderia sp. BL10I2N1]|nr:hypothetical protein B0G77_8168 [Paraburkholderia sp. BL10I2N1]
MTAVFHRYVVGVWESLWPSEPYMKHRILVDLKVRAVIAGEDRAHHCWTAMSVEHLEYMQQILDETYSDFLRERQSRSGLMPASSNGRFRRAPAVRMASRCAGRTAVIGQRRSYCKYRYALNDRPLWR